jgi:hypothetical protein
VLFLYRGHIHTDREEGNEGRSGVTEKEEIKQKLRKLPIKWRE